MAQRAAVSLPSPQNVPKLRARTTTAPSPTSTATSTSTLPGNYHKTQAAKSRSVRMFSDWYGLVFETQQTSPIAVFIYLAIYLFWQIFTCIETVSRQCFKAVVEWQAHASQSGRAAVQGKHSALKVCSGRFSRREKQHLDKVTTLRSPRQSRCSLSRCEWNVRAKKTFPSASLTAKSQCDVHEKKSRKKWAWYECKSQVTVKRLVKPVTTWHRTAAKLARRRKFAHVKISSLSTNAFRSGRPSMPF